MGPVGVMAAGGSACAHTQPFQSDLLVAGAEIRSMASPGSMKRWAG